MGIVKKFLAGEAGSMMNTVVFLVIVIAIVGIGVIDGSSVFYANQATSETAKESADLARQEYLDSHSDIQAENIAADRCEAKNLTFVAFKVNPGAEHTYQVTCGKDAKTYVFKYLPFLKNLTHQENTETSSMY